VSSASSAPAGPSAAAIAAICGAEVLGLTGYSTVPALLPQFIEVWSLTNTQAGWLAGIVSAGYAGRCPSGGPDRSSAARLIYLASSMLSAPSCFGVALLPALGFRGLAGIALAGTYMPGLQALTHGVEGTRRARIAAWYTSCFTIGARCRSCWVGSECCWASAALSFSPVSSVPLYRCCPHRVGCAAESGNKPLLFGNPTGLSRNCNKTVLKDVQCDVKNLATSSGWPFCRRSKP